MFNAETQLNVSIYTVEICKVAGTALTVHAVIHNDMHKTQHYPIGSKHTHIYIYIKPTDRIFQQTNDTSDIHFLMKQFLCGLMIKYEVQRDHPNSLIETLKNHSLLGTIISNPWRMQKTYIYIYMNQQVEYSSDIHFLMKQFLCGFIDKI